MKLLMLSLFKVIMLQQNKGRKLFRFKILMLLKWAFKQSLQNIPSKCL